MAEKLKLDQHNLAGAGRFYIVLEIYGFDLDSPLRLVAADPDEAMRLPAHFAPIAGGSTNGE